MKTEVVSALSAQIVLICALVSAFIGRRKRPMTWSVIGRTPNKRRKREGIVAELLELPDATFLRMMRMPKHLFLQLAHQITPHLRSHWTVRLHTFLFVRIIRCMQAHSRKMAKVGNGSVIDTEAILAATIRWLAGGSVWDVSFMFKISAEGTFHNYKWRVIDALNIVLADNIVFPTSDVGLSCLADLFHDRDKDNNIPNVVAAVDCVILEMRAPKRSKFGSSDKATNISSQFCRKGFFATTVLAFVDANMRFLSVSINCGASSHDSTVFGCSEMGYKLTLPKSRGGIDPKWIVVGDDAFKGLPHVMTPFQKTWLTNEQKNFNYCLSKLRSTVECAFGLWKGKWGIFWRPLRVQQKNIAKLVQVTCRLHNLCINRHVSDNLADFVVADDIFWQRTCSDAVRQKYAKRGRLPPVAPAANANVAYADAASVSEAFHVVPTAQGMRQLRRIVMQGIARSGKMRSIPRLPPKCPRLRSVSGTDQVAQVRSFVICLIVDVLL